MTVPSQREPQPVEQDGYKWTPRHPRPAGLPLSDVADILADLAALNVTVTRVDGGDIPDANLIIQVATRTDFEKVVAARGLTYSDLSMNDGAARFMEAHDDRDGLRVHIHCWSASYHSDWRPKDAA